MTALARGLQATAEQMSPRALRSQQQVLQQQLQHAANEANFVTDVALTGNAATTSGSTAAPPATHHPSSPRRVAAGDATALLFTGPVSHVPPGAVSQLGHVASRPDFAQNSDEAVRAAAPYITQLPPAPNDISKAVVTSGDGAASASVALQVAAATPAAGCTQGACCGAVGDALAYNRG